MADWDDQLAHFNSVHWCAKILSDPDLIVRPLNRRSYAHKGHAFESSAATMSTTAFISNFIAFMHPLTAGVEAADDAYNAPAEDLSKQPLKSRFASTVSFLLSLGHGLTTFREGFWHGGVVATIFDECNRALGLANEIYGLMKPPMHVTRLSRRNPLIFHTFTWPGLAGSQERPARTMQS